MRIPIGLCDWYRDRAKRDPFIKAHVQLGLRTVPDSDPHVCLDVFDRVKRRHLVIDLPRRTALLLATQIINAYLESHLHDQ